MSHVLKLVHFTQIIRKRTGIFWGHIVLLKVWVCYVLIVADNEIRRVMFVL